MIAAKQLGLTGLERAPNYEYTAKDIRYGKINFAASILYYTVVSTTKLSILFMYDRIFSVNGTFRRLVFSFALLTGAFWVATTVSNFLICIPIRYIWGNAYPNPRFCMNLNYYWLGYGIAESILDLLIIPLPIKMVLGLNLSRARKIAVVAIFILGVLYVLSHQAL